MKGERNRKRGPIDRERSWEIREEAGSGEEEEFSKVNKDEEAGEKVRAEVKNKKTAGEISRWPQKSQTARFSAVRGQKKKKENLSWFLLQQKIEVAAIEV